MPIVIPIYLQEETALWRSPAGQKILKKSLESVIPVNGLGSILVVSDDAEMLLLGKHLGIATSLREIDAEAETSRILPFGSKVALEASQATFPASTDPVMLVDFRNPLLASQDLEEAMHEFEARSVERLVSVVAMRDNPCQLEACYDLLDSGIIHCFESGSTVRERVEQCGLTSLPGIVPQSLLVTLPFPFDWSARGVRDAAKSSCYLRVHRTDRLIEYCRLTETVESGLSFSGQFIWAYEGPNTARLIVPKTVFGDWHNREDFSDDYQLVGASLEQGKSTPSVLLFQGADNRLCVKMSDKRSDCCIGIIPVTDPAVDEPTVSRIDEDGRLFFDGPQGVPFAYWILQEIGSEGFCAVSLPFPGEGVLWKTDHGSGQKVNLKTGEAITGRQNFPEVYSPQGSVSILAADGYENFDEYVSTCRCYGWILDDRKNLRITSEFDLLRYQSLVEDS